MKVGIRGFHELSNSLKALERNAKALHGHHEVPFSELFPPAFIRQHTKVSSFEELLEASPYDVKTKKDFEKIPDDSWDEYIQDATQFSSWVEMMQTAAGEYAKRKLFAGTGWGR